MKKIGLKDKKIKSGDTSLTADDIIINDSFLSDIEDDNKKNKNKNNDILQGNNGLKDILFNNIYLILLFFGIFLICKFLGKEYLIIILLTLVVYYLYLINSKLDKLCISKKF